MAVFKCKMCGGELDLSLANGNIVECAYCTTTQTIPSQNDEKLGNLFNQAHRLRNSNDFDAAMNAFRSIIVEFPQEAEAYWGLCLCEYGIEYVKDPLTEKRIPTCHRTSFESIFDSENYKKAIEYADVVAREQYKTEAAEIDRLQKAILNIVNREEPFDVFISYKDTIDGTKDRTKDSVIAERIYHALTEKGYKVFFSRITLESKLGQEYEPYIFSALYKSKVMLVVGTCRENFEAVWVKNEWSRFLDMMKTQRDKSIFACYQDIDPKDLPNALKSLQGQDMSKWGAVEDIVRGISKIIPLQTAAAAPVQQVVQRVGGANTENLLKRGYMALQSSDWEGAGKFFERVLDEDAECSGAYLGKLLAEYRLTGKDNLGFCAENYTSSANFKQAYRFANPAEKNEINDLVYTSASATMAKGVPLKTKQNGVIKFEAIADYRDSREQAKTLRYAIAVEQFTIGDPQNIRSAISGWEKIRDYKDSEDWMKDATYTLAMLHMNKGDQQSLQEAIKTFEGITDWKDSAQKMDECMRKIELIDINSARAALENRMLTITAKKENAIQEVAECQETANIIENGKKKSPQWKRFRNLIVSGVLGFILTMIGSGAGVEVMLTIGTIMYLGYFIGSFISLKNSSFGNGLVYVINFFTYGLCALVLTFIDYRRFAKQHDSTRGEAKHNLNVAVDRLRKIENEEQQALQKLDELKQRANG